MAIDHVEMALVDRHVDRLADRAARRMHRRCHIGELHEIAEILDRRIAAVAFEVTHEGRAIDRREDRRLPANVNAALRVARMPGEFLWRGLQQFAAKTLGEMYALATNIRTGVLPELERFRVLTELDADFLQNAIGIVFDQAEAFLIQNFVFANLAGDVGKRRARATAGAGRAACCSTPAGTSAAPSAISLGCGACKFDILIHGSLTRYDGLFDR